jgi:hypothetical protein
LMAVAQAFLAACNQAVRDHAPRAAAQDQAEMSIS